MSYESIARHDNYEKWFGNMLMTVHYEHKRLSVLMMNLDQLKKLTSLDTKWRSFCLELIAEYQVEIFDLRSRL